MPLVLVVVFIVVPLLELWLVIEVGGLIGVLPTIALLLGVSIAGAWLVKREGLRAWQGLRNAVAQSRVPTRELLDGALVLVGGVLLLTPGFLTDIVGLLLILPPTRFGLNRLLRRRVRVLTAVPGLSGRRQSRRVHLDDPIDVEVVDIERTPRSG